MWTPGVLWHGAEGPPGIPHCSTPRLPAPTATTRHSGMRPELSCPLLLFLLLARSSVISVALIGQSELSCYQLCPHSLHTCRPSCSPTSPWEPRSVGPSIQSQADPNTLQTSVNCQLLRLTDLVFERRQSRKVTTPATCDTPKAWV